MKAYYNQEPETVSYMKLPNGKADVWLRKNIAETTDEEGRPVWEADEVYFRTGQDQGSIEAAFDELFANDGEEKNEEPENKPSIEERMDAIETAFMEFVEEVMANG